MNQITPRPPLGLKPDKVDKPKARKAMARKSKKRAAQHASLKGQQDLAHMACVRELPCVGCGTRINVKAHHCKDKPPLLEQKIYERMPIGRKSGATDTIPLCEPGCHKDSGHGYHDGRDAWNAKHGPDYSYIQQTRNAVAEMQESVGF